MNILTDEQEYGLAQVRETKDNLLFHARAGSGKTFMLKLIAQELKGSTLYVTFSKLLADEARKKLPNIDCKTGHGLCYGTAKKFYSVSKKLDLNDYYRDQHLFEFLGRPEFDDTGMTYEEAATVRDLRREFLDLLKYCKLNMADDLEGFQEVAHYYGLCPEQWMFPLIKKSYEFSSKPSRNINFTEMVHTPLMLNLPLPQYDNILTDEVQDSSLMLIELYKRCLKPGGRIILVGDDRQAIYGFAGSRNDAMHRVADIFDTKPLSLSVNFRCGINHLKLAQEIVPDIKPHDNAIDGDAIFTSSFKPSDGELVLCRTNAPLVAPCLKLIKEGVKASIKGRDIAGPINTILKKVNHLGVNAAIDQTMVMLEADMKLAAARNYKSHSVDAITERYEIARQFLVESETVAEASNKLYKIFKDNETEGIVFSSAHKAKGLEAPKVTILDYPKIRLHRKDMLPWQIEQEANLHYVALTRPQQTLTMIVDEDKDKV